VLPNSVVQRFADGYAALGLGIQQLRSVAAVGLAQCCGFHFLFVDLEHGPLSCAMAVDIAVAGLHAGLPALARVPGKDSPEIARLLDGGAQGIVVPHVDTPEEARAVANACKYPPWVVAPSSGCSRSSATSGCRCRKPWSRRTLRCCRW